MDAEHIIPHKGEHHERDVHNLPKDQWKAEYHGGPDETDEIIIDEEEDLET